MVLETRHGLLVERLLEAGYVVVPVNPDLVARRRGPARKKDDAEDARIACLLALDRFARLRPLIPHGELGRRAAGDRPRRRAGRAGRAPAGEPPAPRPHRRFPGRAITLPALTWRGTVFLRFLQRWPTAERSGRSGARGAGRLRPGRPTRLAGAVCRPGAGPSQAEHFTPRAYLVRAKADTIRLAARSCWPVGAQRRAWERRMGELLLGAPRRGRDQEGQPQRGRSGSLTARST